MTSMFSPADRQRHHDKAVAVVALERAERRQRNAMSRLARATADSDIAYWTRRLATIDAEARVAALVGHLAA